MSNAGTLKPGFGLTFEGLYQRDGLVKVDGAFIEFLSNTDPLLAERLLAARGDPSTLAKKDESALLLDVAPHLERFIIALFGIGDELAALAERHGELAPL